MAEVYSAAQLVEMAKVALIKKQPFFGTLLVYLKVEADETAMTAGTDGTRLYYNPGFIDQIYGENSPTATGIAKIGIMKIMGVLSHEVMHAALGHVYRQGSRNLELWNCACDYVVNDIVRQSGLRLPEPHLYNEAFKDLNADQVYTILQSQQNPGDSGAQNANFDDHRGWGQQPQNGRQLRSTGQSGALSDPVAEWQRRLTRAATASATRGNLPGHLKNMVERELAPKIPYQQVLAEYMQPQRCGYTFNPPDRRYVWAGLYLPQFGETGFNDIIIAIDRSGSVTRYFEQFAAECQAILNMHGRTRVILVGCDTVITDWHELDRGESWVKPEMSGGGGTNLSPVFSEIDKRGIEPAALIFLTDGDAEIPQKAPAYPVLWVLTPDGHAPCAWGRSVTMSE